MFRAAALARKQSNQLTRDRTANEKNDSNYNNDNISSIEDAEKRVLKKRKLDSSASLSVAASSSSLSATSTIALTSRMEQTAQFTKDERVESSENAERLENLPHLAKNKATQCWFPLDRAQRVLIGAYPSGVDEVEKLIAERNVRCFVNLTSDRSIESWFSHQIAKKHSSVKLLHRPMLRREQVSDDGKVTNLCREITRWIDESDANNAQVSRIYVFSELGFGRAAVVAAILAGDFEHLQTNAAVEFVHQQRMQHRIPQTRTESTIPTVETTAQIDQIFRFLGNPQRETSDDAFDEEGIRQITNARKRKQQKAAEEESRKQTLCDIARDATEFGGDDGEYDNDDGGAVGCFAPIESCGGDAPISSNSAAATNTTEKSGTTAGKNTEQKPKKRTETEYIELPDRSDKSWLSEADRWIKRRKTERRKETERVAK